MKSKHDNQLQDKSSEKRKWWQSHGDEDRELLELCVMYFLVMIGVSIWAIVAQNSSNAQFSLAFFCLIVFFWFLIRRNDLVAMAKNLKALFDRSVKTGYQQKTDAVIMLCGVLAILSVLFVIDLDILSNSAVRIGAVAAFGLFTTLKAVWYSFK
jgi:hypothetical protein